MVEQCWLRIDDVQQRFGRLIGRDTVIALMKAGHIKSYRLGKSYATTLSDIETFEALIMTAKEPVVFKDSMGCEIWTTMPVKATPEGRLR